MKLQAADRTTVERGASQSQQNAGRVTGHRIDAVPFLQPIYVRCAASNAMRVAGKNEGESRGQTRTHPVQASAAFRAPEGLPVEDLLHQRPMRPPHVLRTVRALRHDVARSYRYVEPGSVDAQATGDRAYTAERVVESCEKIWKFRHQLAGNLLVRHTAVHRLQDEALDLSVLAQDADLLGGALTARTMPMQQARLNASSVARHPTYAFKFITSQLTAAFERSFLEYPQSHPSTRCHRVRVAKHARGSNTSRVFARGLPGATTHDSSSAVRTT